MKWTPDTKPIPVPKNFDVTKLSVPEQIAHGVWYPARDMMNSGVCPNCHSHNVEKGERFRCHACLLDVDPATATFCDRVPIFKEIKKENLWLYDSQIYKHEDRLFVASGVTRGCGRPITGGYCSSCSSLGFLPTPWEKPKRGRSNAGDGKAAASGEEVEVRELEL